MKHTNLSLAGVTAGLFLTVGSWFRYFVLYPDLDKALYFGIIGILIIAASWNYAGRIELKKEIKQTQTILNNVEEWIIDKEKGRKNETN